MTSNTVTAATTQPPSGDNGDAATKWGFATILIILGAFGAFGGGVAAFSQVTFSEVMKSGIQAYGSGKKLAGIVSVGALLGCGGSIAFGFVLAVDRKFGSGVFDLDTKILIAGASVAAGFSGIRLLKLVSDELAKKVQKQEGDINTQQQALQAQEEEMKKQKVELQQQQSELQDQRQKLQQDLICTGKNGQGILLERELKNEATTT